MNITFWQAIALVVIVIPILVVLDAAVSIRRQRVRRQKLEREAEARAAEIRALNTVTVRKPFTRQLYEENLSRVRPRDILLDPRPTNFSRQPTRSLFQRRGNGQATSMPEMDSEDYFSPGWGVSSQPPPFAGSGGSMDGGGASGSWGSSSSSDSGSSSSSDSGSSSSSDSGSSSSSE